jgi:hypothetical protein
MQLKKKERQLNYFDYLCWSICFNQPLLKICVQTCRGFCILLSLLPPTKPNVFALWKYIAWVPLKIIIIWF